MDTKRARQEQIESSIRLKEICNVLITVKARLNRDFGQGRNQFEDARVQLTNVIKHLEDERVKINNTTWSEPAHEDD